MNKDLYKQEALKGMRFSGECPWRDDSSADDQRQEFLDNLDKALDGDPSAILSLINVAWCSGYETA